MWHCGYFSEQLNLIFGEHLLVHLLHPNGNNEESQTPYVSFLVLVSGIASFSNFQGKISCLIFLPQKTTQNDKDYFQSCSINCYQNPTCSRAFVSRDNLTAQSTLTSQSTLFGVDRSDSKKQQEILIREMFAFQRRLLSQVLLGSSFLA